MERETPSKPIPHDTRIRIGRSRRHALIIVFALLLLLRLAAVFVVPYTDTTEARYAEIARKMVETGDWVTPQFDYGLPFWGKPPLHTWMAAAGMELFGCGEFGGRALIFACALGLLVMLHDWVKHERGQDAAWIGTTLLTSCTVFFVSMGAVMTDLALLFGTTLSMAGFWNALQPGRRARFWGYAFFVGQAIGLLAKGPVATVLSALPILPWLFWQGRWRDAWRAIPWISGTLLLLLLTVPWYAAAEMKTPGFLRYFLVGEHFQRFVVSGWKGDLYGSGHAKPRGMIWVYWTLAMLPWTPLLLAPLLRWRQVAAGFSRTAGSWRAYLLCWAMSPMVFFTLATNIIPTYVLTGVPAAAFLAVETWMLAGWMHSRWLHRSFGASVLCLLVTGATGIGIITSGSDALTRVSQKRIAGTLCRTGLQFNYFGKRSYSAEFYTAGRARCLPDAPALRRLAGNGEADALEIHRPLLAMVPPDVLERFDLWAEIGDELILIEKPETTKEVADVR